MSAPAHGDVRNWRMETSHGKEVEYVTTDGETVYKGPGCALTQSVSQRWCAKCESWIDVAGVLGALRFDFEHEHGKAKP